jgi:hypothetical protein
LTSSRFWVRLVLLETKVVFSVQAFGMFEQIGTFSS